MSKTQIQLMEQAIKLLEKLAGSKKNLEQIVKEIEEKLKSHK